MVASEKCLPVVHAAMRRWLAGLQWPADPAEDLVLAVHEAVTNVIEHAYRGDVAGRTVDVRGVVDTGTSSTAGDRGLPETGRRVRFSVSDHGQWRPDQHDRADPSRARGWGLTMMEALTSEMTITASADNGTQVELLSVAVSE